MQYALNLLESGKVKVKDLISATYPLADFGKAMDDVLNNKDHLKVQIVFKERRELKKKVLITELSVELEK